MKSAYELAMERLNQADPKPSKSLTAAQKAKLGEIDKLYQGKIAEREIFLKQQLNQALAEQNREEFEQIKRQMASERTRLEEEREQEKEAVRTAK